MKKVFGVLAFLSFIALFGTVGAMEQDMISLTRGMVQAGIALVCMEVFCRLCGAYDYSYTYDEDKESRPRSATSKGGKRKSSI